MKVMTNTPDTWCDMDAQLQVFSRDMSKLTVRPEDKQNTDQLEATMEGILEDLRYDFGCSGLAGTTVPGSCEVLGRL
jgi:hypothetical protein